jgi:hypothetical protein
MVRIKMKTNNKTTRYIVELPSSHVVNHPNLEFVMSDVEKAREELRDTQQKLNGTADIDDEMTLADAKEQLAKTLAENPIPEIKMNVAPSRTKSEARRNLRRTQALLRKGKEGTGSV